VWGQQHDALTLQPVAGRNYEPAAQSSSESASMMQFLQEALDRYAEWSALYPLR
jgi:PelA/Pel-15E family pectate lyase